MNWARIHAVRVLFQFTIDATRSSLVVAPDLPADLAQALAVATERHRKLRLHSLRFAAKGPIVCALHLVVCDHVHEVPHKLILLCHPGHSAHHVLRRSARLVPCKATPPQVLQASTKSSRDKELSASAWTELLNLMLCLAGAGSSDQYQV